MSGPHTYLSRVAFAGVSLVLLGLVATPVMAQPRKPTGAEVWSTNCGRCHRLRAVDAYNASQWDAIVSHMSLNARLTPDETAAIREFLVGGARARQGTSAAVPSAPAPELGQFASTGAELYLSKSRGVVAVCSSPSGKATFDAQCRMCHGANGKGDGPAAVGLNPRPANLSDGTRMARLSDDSLVKVLTRGRNAMPAFGTILKPDQLRDVAAYIRCFSATAEILNEERGSAGKRARTPPAPGNLP